MKDSHMAHLIVYMMYLITLNITVLKVGHIILKGVYFPDLLMERKFNSQQNIIATFDYAYCQC